MEKPSSPRRLIQDEKLLSHHLKSLDNLLKGDLEKAQKQLESLSSSNSFEILTLNNLSVTYSKQRNYNKAIGSLLKALAKCKLKACHREHLGTLINLTVAASNLNIHNEALNYAFQAKQLLREEDSEVASVVYFNLGLELFHMSRFIEAEENLTKVLTVKHLGFPNTHAVKALISQCVAHQLKEPRPCQVVDFMKRTVKKNCSAPQITSNLDRKLEKIDKSDKKEEKTEKKEEKVEKEKVEKEKIEKKEEKNVKKVEKHEKVLICFKQKSTKDLKIKSVRPQKAFRAGSLLSGRRAVYKIAEGLNGSSTSSTESLPSGSFLRNSLSSSKSLRKMIGSDKSSKQLTPVNQACKILAKNDFKLGSCIQSIGDHLNSLERNMNSFAELYKPLKTLAEDPDELLDSNRNVTSQAQQKILSQIYRKRLAAIKIQRAFRKFRAKRDSVEKALLTFKDNPLFKPGLPSLKGKCNKVGVVSASKAK